MRAPPPVVAPEVTAPVKSGTCPGVSVVIPAFNYAHYLPMALDSVLAQSYFPLDVIVVDDDSTDGTAAVVKAYPTVRYVHQAHAGLSAARNTGIGAARFDLIAFLDADDQWKSPFLFTLVTRLLALPPMIGVIACRQELMDERGLDIPQVRWHPDADTDRVLRMEDMLIKTRFGASGIVARRACFDTCGRFDTTLTSSEDRDMWLRIARRWSIFYLSQGFTRVRRHASNMSRQPDRMRHNMNRVLIRAFRERFLPVWPWSRWLRIWSYRHVQSAWMYHDATRQARAIGELCLSVLVWPWRHDARDLDLPPLFRLRAFRHFFRDWIRQAYSNRASGGPQWH